MAEDPLVQARKRAEGAVHDMDEGPLKVAAFQTILAKLLADSSAAGGVQGMPSKGSLRSGGQPGSLTERILAIKSEGFFKAQRTLGEVREALRSRGWHYPATTMSGVMQGLVQRRQLRREQTSDGKKKAWRYSNP
jgi:hypothetical protein